MSDDPTETWSEAAIKAELLIELFAARPKAQEVSIGKNCDEARLGSIAPRWNYLILRSKLVDKRASA